MKCKFVFDDWRIKGRSVYHKIPELSMGDMHSGTTFEVEIICDKELEEDIKEAMLKYRAYPVMAIICQPDEMK